jgi:hypothetical protein
MYSYLFVDDGIAKNGSPLVIGKAGGCHKDGNNLNTNFNKDGRIKHSYLVIYNYRQLVRDLSF